MADSVNWCNPYQSREGEWLRGNLHTHTSPASACGQVPLDRMLDLYIRAGYDFLAISDHMVCTPVVDAPLLCIPGVEWNSEQGEHAGLYGDGLLVQPDGWLDRAQSAVLATVTESGGFAVLNHPNWTYRPHYHREELLNAGPYNGVEIFNGVIKRLEGYEIATDKWDYLLAHGRRVLGVASDDAHIEDDVAQGWLMVRVVERTPQAVFAALKQGNFYASSGVTMFDIRREGDRLEVETDDAQEIQVIGEGGRLLQTVRDHSVQFDLATAECVYVRVTAFGQGSAMAWTQPFFMR
jgi:hypothetical protein